MASRRMRAVHVSATQAIDIREVDRPEPGARELVVAPAASGICGTDLHIVKGEFPQARFPVVPCHEFAGTVVAVGRDVTDFREGDLVTCDPNVPCQACRWCLAGRPNLCINLSVIGVTRPGAAADEVAVPARCTWRLPDGVSASLGAIVEPLACACNAIARAGPLGGKRVLVMGSGIMGLLITILAGRERPSEVWVSDPATQKHPMAIEAGATRVVAPDALEGELFDVVFEASGAPPATAQVLELLNPMGTWVQVGVLAATAKVGIRPFLIFDREVTIVGSNSLADKFPAALELIPAIAEQAAALVTNRLSVWDFETALNSARSPNSVKTQLTY